MKNQSKPRSSPKPSKEANTKTDAIIDKVKDNPTLAWVIAGAIAAGSAASTVNDVADMVDRFSEPTPTTVTADQISQILSEHRKDHLNELDDKTKRQQLYYVVATAADQAEEIAHIWTEMGSSLARADSKTARELAHRFTSSPYANISFVGALQGIYKELPSNSLVGKKTWWLPESLERMQVLLNQRDVTVEMANELMNDILKTAGFLSTENGREALGSYRNYVMMMNREASALRTIAKALEAGL
jgi:hypothetical protein